MPLWPLFLAAVLLCVILNVVFLGAQTGFWDRSCPSFGKLLGHAQSLLDDSEVLIITLDEAPDILRQMLAQSPPPR
jgi:hypothetical protein